MRFGSVCSGIEAASVAWEPLGWRAAWFSEIEPFPSAVLAHHYPNVPNLGDMTALPDLILNGQVEAPDVFCGGTPCQAFSVAGLRRSLDDARGNLSLTFCEIANAIDSVRSVRGEQPAIIFWENVPGVLSTRDNAFGCFLAGLAGEDLPLEPPGGKWTDAGAVFGPARAVAWRTLDAQFFGLAQRRRRVFVVASARANFDPAAVLFEFDGVRRDTAPSREAGKVAPTIPSRSTAGGGLGTDFDCDGGVISIHPHCIGRAPNAGPQGKEYLADGSAYCMDSRGQPQAVAQPYTLAIRGRGDNHNLEYRQDGTANALLTPNGGRGGIGIGAIAHSLRGEGFDASEDGTGRGTPLVPVIGWDNDLNASRDQMGTLVKGGAGGRHEGVMVPIGVFQDSEFGVQQYDSAGTLRAGRIPEHQMVMQPVAFHPTQDPISSENVCHSIGANDNATTAVAIRTAQTGSNGCGINTEGTAYTLDSAQQAVAFDPYNQACAPVTHTLRKGRSATGDEIPQTVTNMQVRRLTPVECERLQGFPDNYTAIPWRGKPADQCPDGPRYKALGNSWAVPVVRWIGARIDCIANLV